jgi:catechol 2,3-dioxygenase
MKTIHPHTHIGSVTLKVIDLEKSVQFYTKTIGLKILSQEGSEVTLTADGVMPLLILTGDSSLIERPVRSAGLYHLALLVPTRKDLANVLHHFIRTNTRLVGGSNHLFSEAIYLQDPENNGIEIYRDVERERWVRDQEGNLVSASEPLDAEGLLREANRSEWSGLPEKTTMGHVHLNVNDMKAAEQFYVNVLGFEEQMRMADHALFISAGGYHHHIALNVWNGREAALAQQDAAGLKYFEILLASDEEFEKMKKALEMNQVEFTIQEGNLHVNDPAGNGIIIKQK